MWRKVSGGKGFRQIWPGRVLCYNVAGRGSPRWEGRKELGVPETNSSNQYFQFQEKVLGVPSDFTVKNPTCVKRGIY